MQWPVRIPNTITTATRESAATPSHAPLVPLPNSLDMRSGYASPSADGQMDAETAAALAFVRAGKTQTPDSVYFFAWKVMPS
jgi:hypothetical protein